MRSGGSTVKVNFDFTAADIVKLKYAMFTSSNLEDSFRQYVCSQRQWKNIQFLIHDIIICNLFLWHLFGFPVNGDFSRVVKLADPYQVVKNDSRV